MKTPLTKTALALVASLLIPAIPNASSAMSLWDQSALDPNGPGIANSYSPGFNGFIIHSVNDVTVDGSGWNVQSIRQYYSSWNFNWLGAITTGYLHVSPKTGPLPTFDPTTDIQVPMSATSIDGSTLAVTASGLSVDLAPGEYWVGITPLAPAGISGANLQYATAPVGVDVASHISGSWTNNYPGYDGAILIEGERPVSVDATTWGSIKNLYR